MGVVIGGVFDITRFAPQPSDVPALLLLVVLLVAELTRGGGDGGCECEAM